MKSIHSENAPQNNPASKWEKDFLFVYVCVSVFFLCGFVLLKILSCSKQTNHEQNWSEMESVNLSKNEKYQKTNFLQTKNCSFWPIWNWISGYFCFLCNDLGDFGIWVLFGCRQSGMKKTPFLQKKKKTSVST